MKFRAIHKLTKKLRKSRSFKTLKVIKIDGRAAETRESEKKKLRTKKKINREY